MLQDQPLFWKTPRHGHLPDFIRGRNVHYCVWLNELPSLARFGQRSIVEAIDPLGARTRNAYAEPISPFPAGELSCHGPAAVFSCSMEYGVRTLRPVTPSDTQQRNTASSHPFLAGVVGGHCDGDADRVCCVLCSGLSWPCLHRHLPQRRSNRNRCLARQEAMASFALGLPDPSCQSQRTCRSKGWTRTHYPATLVGRPVSDLVGAKPAIAVELARSGSRRRRSIALTLSAARKVPGWPHVRMEFLPKYEARLCPTCTQSVGTGRILAGPRRSIGAGDGEMIARISRASSAVLGDRSRRQAKETLFDSIRNSPSSTCLRNVVPRTAPPVARYLGSKGDRCRLTV